MFRIHSNDLGARDSSLFLTAISTPLTLNLTKNDPELRVILDLGSAHRQFLLRFCTVENGGKSSSKKKVEYKKG